MNRISRHMMFMQTAEVVSRRSTCFRRNVGAVIVRDKNIVSIGYNGSPAGEPHCTGNGCASPLHGCLRAIHAERNALDHVAYGTPLDVWDMYVTESPCPTCAMALIDSPVKRVFFLNAYRVSEGREIVMAAQISLYRMTPAGHIIDCRTEELVEIP